MSTDRECIRYEIRRLNRYSLLAYWFLYHIGPYEVYRVNEDKFATGSTIEVLIGRRYTLWAAKKRIKRDKKGEYTTVYSEDRTERTFD